MKDSASMPKKEALIDIVKAMKGLRIEKMKGYKKSSDEEPSIEAEVETPSKDTMKCDGSESCSCPECSEEEETDED
jgi:hypothetical protein